NGRRRNLLINDMLAPDDRVVKTVTFDTLRFAAGVGNEGDEYEVEVQLAHPKLSVPVDLTQEIEIAPILEQGLKSLIASYHFAGMGGEEALAKAALFETSYRNLA